MSKLLQYMYVVTITDKHSYLHVLQSVKCLVEDRVDVGGRGAVRVVEDDDWVGAELRELHGLPVEPLVVDGGDQVTVVVLLPARRQIKIKYQPTIIHESQRSGFRTDVAF